MKLIFVYNAKSGTINSLIDYSHKLISPKTYNCNLCKLTHSNIGERKEWKSFITQLNVGFDFYHSDEFEKKFDSKLSYPIILNDKMNVVVDNKAISNLKSTNDLTQVLSKLI